MRTAVVALTLTSAAFAATTVYFARELQIERASAAAVPPIYSVSSVATAPGTDIESAPAPAPSPTSAPTTVTFATITGPGTMASVAPAPDSTYALIQAEQRKYQEQLIKRLDDPEQRAEMLEEFRMMMRSSNPRLAQTLKMSGEETERLIELLAQQQLDQQEKFARCSVDSSCDLQSIGRDTAGSSQRELANLLGPERQQKFEHYRNTMGERASVTELRTRLSDPDFLPEEKAEALIVVLADERSRISLDASKRGGGLMHIGSGTGTIIMAGESPEAQLESARENSQRLRTRAAEVLTPAQLRVFEEMQEELLRSTRQQLRQMRQFNAVTVTTTN